MAVTLYTQQNLLEPPTSSLLTEILEAARDPAVEHVILDLRHNLGGDAPHTSRRTSDPHTTDAPADSTTASGSYPRVDLMRPPVRSGSAC